MGGNVVRAGGIFGRFKQHRPIILAAIVFSVAMLVGTPMEIDASRASSTARGRSSARGNVPIAQRSIAKQFKATLKYYVRAFGDVPWIAPLVHNASVKRVISALPGSRLLYGSEWDRRHPFDRSNGTDTSGFLFGGEFLTGHPAEEHGSPYAGVQPSVLRTVLAKLPQMENSTFIDLGCGKGRPMLIASEFAFRDIVGVELSPPLAEVARKNAAAIAKRFPARTPVRVEEGDATAFPMPAGDVVLFLYNSFDRELTLKVAQNVATALAADGQRSIYIIYCNPASGSCFDDLPALTRRFAQTLAYAPEEQGFSPDAEDAVIVWQGGQAPAPTERADAEIVIIKERWRAGLRAWGGVA